jgi:hypothetical protein
MLEDKNCCLHCNKGPCDGECKYDTLDKNSVIEKTQTLDALGNPIQIGKKYGYSQQSSGHVTIVIGTVEKINELKVTLNNVEERRGLWGEITESFKPESRRRSVNACHLFPI